MYNGPLSKPFGEEPPKVGPPAPELSPSYLDGNVGGLVGQNPGRDQDRDRQCECVSANFHYTGGDILGPEEPGEGSNTGF